MSQPAASPPQPHALSIFSIIPRNSHAEAVLQHPRNAWLVSTVHGQDNTVLRGLNIGPHIAATAKWTLATIGRNADIVVDDAQVSRTQCSFEVNDKTGAILCQDKSSRQNTHMCDPTYDFEAGRTPRQVLVSPEINREFWFGTRNGKQWHFAIIWHQGDADVGQLLNSRIEPSWLARTIVEADTAPCSRIMTRVHTPAPGVRRIKWLKRGLLGQGSFGEVWSAINAHDGNVFAVKVIKIPDQSSASHASRYQSLKREVNILDKISHPNIVEFIGSQPDEHTTNEYHIFMSLADGSVYDLIPRQTYRGPDAEAELHNFFNQMLNVLVYLHDQNIIHRDIKPQNILYTRREQAPDDDNGGAGASYHYQLADFGLSKIVDTGHTFVGTMCYIAPELFRDCEQTTKADVWALVVTLLVMVRSQDCKLVKLCNPASIVSHITEAIEQSKWGALRPMAYEDPAKRESAREVRARMYGSASTTSTQSQSQETIVASVATPVAGKDVVSAKKRVRNTKIRQIADHKEFDGGAQKIHYLRHVAVKTLTPLEPLRGRGRRKHRDISGLQEIRN
ncbi:ATP binding [Recurvomyces mirabilis]|uniref:mitogen-activated protein kinase n=1 Tax=Recurvomyces mirabilis TaxID=574656 RepID=A0AAE0TSL4_9PEZI|nr:ATP binding [Recurvomyces mirabilis]